eukprot:PhF_6_TR696/c1_g1_i2/m.1120
MKPPKYATVIGHPKSGKSSLCTALFYHAADPPVLLNKIPPETFQNRTLTTPFERERMQTLVGMYERLHGTSLVLFDTPPDVKGRYMWERSFLSHVVVITIRDVSLVSTIPYLVVAYGLVATKRLDNVVVICESEAMRDEVMTWWTTRPQPTDSRPPVPPEFILTNGLTDEHVANVLTHLKRLDVTVPTPPPPP